MFVKRILGAISVFSSLLVGDFGLDGNRPLELIGGRISTHTVVVSPPEVKPILPATYDVFMVTTPLAVDNGLLSMSLLESFGLAASASCSLREETTNL